MHSLPTFLSMTNAAGSCPFRLAMDCWAFLACSCFFVGAISGAPTTTVRPSMTRQMAINLQLKPVLPH